MRSGCSKRKAVGDGERPPLKAARAEETRVHYYFIPRDVVKWILSFVTDPRDFVALRTVCREWNMLLGDLFFGTARMRTKELKAIVTLIRPSFPDLLPLVLVRDVLMVSAVTNHPNCAAEIRFPVETTGMGEKSKFFFAMPTDSLSNLLRDSKEECTVLAFSVTAGRVACKAGGRALVAKASRDGYDAPIHTARLGHDEWEPAHVPSHDLEVETTAIVFLVCGLYGQPTYVGQVKMTVYRMQDATFPGGDVLMISVTPSTIKASFRFDYYFKKQDDAEGEPTRWGLLWSFELRDIERTRGQRLVPKEDDVVFVGYYFTFALKDTLSGLSPDSRITLCIPLNGGERNPLVIKYPGRHCTPRRFDVLWVVRQ